MSPTRRRYVGAIFAALLGLTMGWSSIPAVAETATALRFRPSVVSARPAETVRLEVWVEEVTDLDRLEFEAQYDAVVLEPVDAEPEREGIQMEIGPLFTRGCVPLNEAGDGTLRFRGSRTPDRAPFSGTELVAVAIFRVREGTPPGDSTLSFDPAAVQLLDGDGRPIPVVELGTATVRIPFETQTLRGRVTREGFAEHERSGVTAFFYPTDPVPPVSWARTCTDDQGDFYLPVPGEAIPSGLQIPDALPPAGPYEWALVRLEFTGYLDECYWEPLDEEVVDIGRHTLEGGDINHDGCINIYDVVRIISAFGDRVPQPCFIPYEPCPTWADYVAPLGDLNGDCRVNILDLTITAENFGLCTNCP